MIKQFRQATRLKQGQASIIREMAEDAKHFCQDQHIFELMFDFNKNINCERLIRHAIGKEDPKTYSFYDEFTSGQFQDMIQENWDRLSQVLADIKTDDEKAPPAISQTSKTKPPVIGQASKIKPPVVGQASETKPPVRSDKTNL